MSVESSIAAVGPFTGFGNFLAKELRDWWNSWRLIVVFLIMTTLLVLMVFFAFKDELDGPMIPFTGTTNSPPSHELIATRFLLQTWSPGGGLVLQIFIIIFSTMGLLTTEKSSGTLAWNLTKPLGRTGLLVAKWLAGTSVLWLAMCVFPLLIAIICMALGHGITPIFSKLFPVIAGAFLWIGLWVLLALTISLGFQSQAAVAGILLAFWIIPNLFGLLMRQVLGQDTMSFIVDRLATNSPFWSYDLFADDDLFLYKLPPRKNVFYYAFVAWFIVLSVVSLRIFNRQEIST